MIIHNEYVGYVLSIDSSVFLENMAEQIARNKYKKYIELKFVIDGESTSISLDRLKEILKEA